MLKVYNKQWIIFSTKIHKLCIEKCPKPEPDIFAEIDACNECEKHLKRLN